MTLDLHLGDCLEILKTLPDASVDSVVCDPPYHLTSQKGGKSNMCDKKATFADGSASPYSRMLKGFMGQTWDGGDISFRPDVWRECLRVLKPGGHLIAFGGTRTSHRITCAIEDAGFEIRDMIAWAYGSGMPKIHDVGKAIDKAAGAERKVVGTVVRTGAKGSGGKICHEGGDMSGVSDITAPATDAAKQWDGWMNCLKPAIEPVVLARKPIERGLTIAENVVKWGTGALNVGACRVATSDTYSYPKGAGGTSFSIGKPPDGSRTAPVKSNPSGRYPANLILSAEEEVFYYFPNTKSTPFAKPTCGFHDSLGRERRTRTDGSSGYSDEGSAARFFKQIECDDEVAEVKPYIPNGKNKVYGKNMGGGAHPGFDDRGDGSTARFFKQVEQDDEEDAAARLLYISKPSRAERELGLDDAVPATVDDGRDKPIDNPYQRGETLRRNVHPTCKPIALMRYLCRLVTQPGGVVLDPFMGSGTTGIAALREGFSFVGIELDDEYMAIAKKRIAAA